MAGEGGAADLRQPGGWHTCGVKSNGTLACWGANCSGQTTAPSGTFVQVSARADDTCDGVDTVGLLRGNLWYLRNSNSSGIADLVFQYGVPPGDRPIAGDWNGDGVDTIGVLRGNLWYLRNSNSAGTADITFQYGAPSDTMLAWR